MRNYFALVLLISVISLWITRSNDESSYESRIKEHVELAVLPPQPIPPLDTSKTFDEIYVCHNYHWFPFWKPEEESDSVRHSKYI